MSFRRSWYRKANRHLWALALGALGEVNGRRVLFVGCGQSAGSAAEIARRGAEVWCLDISLPAIREFRRSALGPEGARVHALVADAHRMPFARGTFDVAVGKAIVHHLDVARFMEELERVCTAGARIVFSEPLGMNPLINLFRRLTPKLRDAEEHPLTPRDVRAIRRRSDGLRLRHDFLFSMASFPFFFAGLPRLGGLVFRLGDWVDQALFAVCPPARWLAWSVLLAGRTRGEAARTG